MRISQLNRFTRETKIEVKLTLEGSGQHRVVTPIGMWTHLLETLARHGAFDLELRAEGDIGVDPHHLVEDCGLVLGGAFAQALGDRAGICRAGFFLMPMDEALAEAAVDLGGRGHLEFCGTFRGDAVAALPTGVVVDFFAAFAAACGANLHLTLRRGRSDHHCLEALFKAFARALRQACEPDLRMAGAIPSTKEVLS